MKQENGESVQEWYERFKLQIKVIESVGGSFGHDFSLLEDAGMDTKDTSQTIKDLNEVAKIAKEKYLAYMFLVKADNTRYGKLKDSLSEDYNKDSTNHAYRATLNSTYNLLLMTRVPHIHTSTIVTQ